MDKLTLTISSRTRLRRVRPADEVKNSPRSIRLTRMWPFTGAMHIGTACPPAPEADYPEDGSPD